MPLLQLLLVAPLTMAQPSPRPPGLEAYRGKVVVLNYWASWCQPCRAELPMLSRVRTRLDWLFGDRAAAPPEELALPAGITAEHFREHHESGEEEDENHEGESAAAEGGSAVPT